MTGFYDSEDKLLLAVYCVSLGFMSSLFRICRGQSGTKTGSSAST